MIYGISITNDNYPLVIGLLKERFELYSQLQLLATASNRFTEVKNTYEAERKIDSLNHRRRILDTKTTDIVKVPVDVIMKLEISELLLYNSL